MADASTSINPLAFGANPWVMGMANFANAYSATDAESLYNTSIFNPMAGGFYGCDPGLMGMMSMYGGMCGMNPWGFMNQMFSPQAYQATLTGKNPMAGMFFNGRTNSAWQQYECNRDTLNVGLRQLHSLALADRQDTFKEKFGELLASQSALEKAMSGNTISNAEAKSRALTHINEAYLQMSGGKTLASTLTKNGDGAFVQGMKDTVGLVACMDDRATVAENVAMVNNTENDITVRREKNKQCIGTGAAVGITGAIAAGAYAAHKGKAAGKWGAAVGFLAGVGAYALRKILD